MIYTRLDIIYIIFAIMLCLPTIYYFNINLILLLCVNIILFWLSIFLFLYHQNKTENIKIENKDLDKYLYFGTVLFSSSLISIIYILITVFHNKTLPKITQ